MRNPQPTPDHVSESNVSVPTGDPPDIPVLSIEPVLMATSPAAEHDHQPTRPQAGGHGLHCTIYPRMMMRRRLPLSLFLPRRHRARSYRARAPRLGLPYWVFTTEPSQIVPTPLSRTSSVTQTLVTHSEPRTSPTCNKLNHSRFFLVYQAVDNNVFLVVLRTYDVTR